MHGASWRARLLFALALIAFASLAIAFSARAEEPAFRAYLDGLWPKAKELGVSRATFDAALQGLKPDLTLPDLVVPGRPKAEPKGQAEFVRPPQDYLARKQLEGLAAQGRVIARQHAATLERIEREIGVDRWTVVAIWGRETAYGRYRLPHDAIMVLATQAWTGRRKAMFETELVHALKMLEDGVPRAAMRSSWAGAVGLTQFMPSEYYQYARDFDGDGRADIFGSVADALASAAAQLKGKGWIPGQTWGYEVRRAATADCSLEGPRNMRPIAEWSRLGYARSFNRTFTPAQAKVRAYLIMPAGTYGPAFLATENFLVIKRYNMSDLYALFVGNLADRIAGGGDFETPWANVKQPATRDIETIQARLKDLGRPVEKIDGKIGSLTRAEIGLYQKANGLAVDCWPGPDMLRHVTSAGR
jgi:lytic murein transglycosylase